MDWEPLIGETALASVLPDVYARYRTPLQGALSVFLEGLPAARREAIAIGQAMLPPTASVSERLALLARSSPVLHKLGQALARDRNLSAMLRGHLQQLESLPPSIPLEVIEETLTRELGPLDRLGVKLVPPALAEASVAVVIPFRFTGGKELLHGVFKVLKPGIEERLDQELGLLERVGSFLDRKCDDFGIPQLDYRRSFEQVRDKLRNEVRLDREQQNLSLARRLHAGDPRVLIPELFDDLCTRRVTAMERVDGRKATDCRPELLCEEPGLAGLLVESLIARPIFSGSDSAPFHGDPHAGNLFLTKDHRLAILDWSLAGSLGNRERISIVQIMLGAIAFDAERIAEVLAGLSERRPTDQTALRSVACEWIGRIQHGQLPGFTWLMGLLDEAVRDAGLRFGGDLMLFRKGIHLIGDLAADIGGGDKLIDNVLLREFLIHFAAEWPWRFMTPPDCRAFATRISNMDLAGLILGLPWSATRYWLGQSRRL